MVKKIAMIVVGLAVGFSFVGCGSSGADRGNSTPVEITKIYKVGVSGDADMHVYKTKIDGVQCFVLDGMKTGGIDCDWN